MTDLRQRRAARRARQRSLALASDARRRLAESSHRPLGKQRGRLWLNGRELGTRDGRFAHLASSYD